MIRTTTVFARSDRETLPRRRGVRRWWPLGAGSLTVMVVAFALVLLFPAAQAGGTGTVLKLQGACNHVALRVDIRPGIGPSSRPDQSVRMSIGLAGIITADSGGGQTKSQSRITPGHPPCVIHGLPNPETSIASVAGTLTGSINCRGVATAASRAPNGLLTITLTERDPTSKQPYRIQEYINLSRQQDGPIDEGLVYGIAIGSVLPGDEASGNFLFQTYSATQDVNAKNCRAGNPSLITQMYVFTNGTSECKASKSCGSLGASGRLDDQLELYLPTDVW